MSDGTILGRRHLLARQDDGFVVRFFILAEGGAICCLRRVTAVTRKYGGLCLVRGAMFAG